MEKLNHPAILVVDMLNDFVTGALGCDRAREIVPATARLLDAARAAGVPVIFCNDCHLPGIDRELQLWGDHAIKGTPGADIIPELGPAPTDYIVPKRRYSGFFQTDLDILLKELGVKTVVGIGTPARHLRELADRYKEAQVAIVVGKVFDDDKSVINYENLGLGRIVYQLPTTLCEMFLSEVFKKNPIEALDQETLYTINKFFENNLNVSETSRKLFVHRNTLVYRLEKIKKLTGLDLREFDHAIIFKVALMVKKYLNSQNRPY